MPRLPWVAVLAILAVFTNSVHAIGQKTCATFASSSSTFSVVSGGTAAPILISPDDWPGVQRAAMDFAMDIHRVTGIMPMLTNDTTSASVTSPPIIVGTLGMSTLIDTVVKNTNLDVSSISGQWESFLAQEVMNPLPGIPSAYVIIGSDKRGSVYAMYDHSEQFGVSPWYWWADVPVTQHAEVYVESTGCAHGAPTVKYRGIFFNDEQPALQNWAMQKFSNATGAYYTGSPFNHNFYNAVFELILRLRGNYLWPAMWSSAFGLDDPLNLFYADMYGVVMGTSHEEPMTRSTPVEWNIFGNGLTWDYSVNNASIYQFWVQGAERSKPYETIFTVGMRGAGDLPMSEGNNIQLLEKIVSDQRQILTDTFPGVNVSTIPQMWCLYKEVEGYYDDGMTVPEDITLMWTDDNWGNIRRFPVPSEMNRTGGAGVYYHYDYVGTPRDFKWIMSSQLTKTFEQMSLAVEREATRIWIVNVGDLKPYEMETEFFLSYGYDSSVWNYDNVDSFVNLWAQREFDASVDQAAQISGILANLTRFNMNRKPELLNTTAYSLINYREASNVLYELKCISEAANEIYNSLSADKQPAFFQLVWHPVTATYNLAQMWIYAGINNLYASQARYSANYYADQVQSLFEYDYELENQYHTLLDGKWDHMMDQTHIGYAYWQQPMTNTMPAVSRLQTYKKNIAGVMRVVPENTMGAWPGDDQYNCANGYGCPNPTITLDPYVPYGNRYIDVAAGGYEGFTWTANANSSWVTFSETGGSIDPSSNPEARVYVSVDWAQVPAGVSTAIINFNATALDATATTWNNVTNLLNVPVTLVANKTVVPSSFHGFVEGDGGISIQAIHASRNTSVEGITWTQLVGFGRTASAVTPWPRMGAGGANFSVGTGPSIEYDFYNFNTIGQAGNVTITTYVAPSMNSYGLDRPIGFAIGVDNETPVAKYFFPYAVPGAMPPQWDTTDGFVADNIIQVIQNFTAPPGAHTVKIWMIEPAVVVQNIVINTGGVMLSYLGPPESIIV